MVSAGNTGLPAGWTADSLVRNYLLGPGVEVWNVKYNGVSDSLGCNAIGAFTSGDNGSGMGFSSGIVMCTGAASVAVGPNNQGGASATCSCGTNHSFTCAALSAIASQTIVNIAVLEFDFKPSSDTIQLNYVFGSEEYPEYVCSAYDKYYRNEIFV